MACRKASCNLPHGSSRRDARPGPSRTRPPARFAAGLHRLRRHGGPLVPGAGGGWGAAGARDRLAAGNLAQGGRPHRHRGTWRRGDGRVAGPADAAAVVAIVPGFRRFVAGHLPGLPRKLGAPWRPGRARHGGLHLAGTRLGGPPCAPAGVPARFERHPRQGQPAGREVGRHRVPRHGGCGPVVPAGPYRDGRHARAGGIPLLARPSRSAAQVRVGSRATHRARARGQPGFAGVEPPVCCRPGRCRSSC